MFGAGHLGDQLPLRGFLTAGMALSGAAVCAVGAAYFLNVHSLWYFVLVQVLGGASSHTRLMSTMKQHVATLSQAWTMGAGGQLLNYRSAA